MRIIFQSNNFTTVKMRSLESMCLSNQRTNFFSLREHWEECGTEAHSVFLLPGSRLQAGEKVLEFSLPDMFLYDL